MRIVLAIAMSCLMLGAVAASALADDLFEEKPEPGLDSALKAQLWREEFRDEPVVVPKQAKRSKDNLDPGEEVDAEVDREIGVDRDDNIGGD